MELRDEQKEFVEYAFNRALENKYNICEMPTAFGKSISALALAKKLIEEKVVKKVIIVTINNALVREIFSEAKHIENLPSHAIMIGKKNYMDEQKFSFLCNLEFEDNIFFKKKKEAQKAIEQLKKSFKNVLLDEFLDMLDITDPDERYFAQKNLELEKNNTNIFDDYKILITNYSFIFHHIFLQKKDMNKNEIFFIFDEIQELQDQANLVFSLRFSIYTYFLQLKSVHKKLESRNTKKSLMQILKKEIEKVKNILNLQQNNNMCGKNIFDETIVSQKAQVLYGQLIEQNQSKTLFAQLRKINQKESIFEISLLLKQIEESKIALKSSDLYISFSDKKGYPSFLSYKKDTNLKLATLFWNNIDRFCGITATALLSKDPQDLDAYTRIGIFLKEIKKDNFFIRGNFNRVCVIKKYKGILSPKQARYFITKRKYIDDDDKRLKYLSEIVARTHKGKNSLVILGGFEEVEKVYDNLSKLGLKNIVIPATREHSMQNTILTFKKQGGILLGTRNYATGVNLKEKELEKLYIYKLPYPVFNNKKWIDIRKTMPNQYWFYYNNDMVINFRQAIGRLIRSPKDRGEIYILDTKFNAQGNKKIGNGLKERLIYFLESVAHKG